MQGSVNAKTTALPQCISQLHRSHIKSCWWRMGWWFVFWFLLFYNTYDIIKSVWLYERR